MSAITWGPRHESLPVVLLRGIEAIRQRKRGIAKTILIAVPAILLLWLSGYVSRTPLSAFPATCTSADIKVALGQLTNAAAVLYVTLTPIVWYTRRGVAILISLGCGVAEHLVRVIAHVDARAQEA